MAAKRKQKYHGIYPILEGEVCPRGHTIVHSGNYFCVEFDDTHCWALAHAPQLSDEDFDFNCAFHDRHGWNCGCIDPRKSTSPAMKEHQLKHQMKQLLEINYGIMIPPTQLRKMNYNQLHRIMAILEESND